MLQCETVAAQGKRHGQFPIAVRTEQKRPDNGECIDLFTAVQLSTKVALALAKVLTQPPVTRLTSELFLPSVGGCPPTPVYLLGKQKQEKNVAPPDVFDRSESKIIVLNLSNTHMVQLE